MDRPRFRAYFLHPRFWLLWLGLGLLWLVSLLPYRLLRRLGRGLGGLMYRLARSRRQIAARNLELCFPELSAMPLGRDRIIADPLEVVRRAPDLILGSWCGKKFRPDRVAARAGWSEVPAVKTGELHEIKSAIILQPGPAALTDGLEAIHALIRRWAGRD